MQRARRPHAIVGVAVLGAALIYVTPTTAPGASPRRGCHFVGASRRGMSAASSSRLATPVLPIAR
jgi:hypothetical protein